VGLADGPAVPPSAFHGIQMDDSVAEQDALSQADAAGIRYIRFNLRWDEIEPTMTTPATYTWAKYDELIANATTAGFSLILTVRDNPAWAAGTACGPIDVQPARFNAFLTDLTARYSAAPYNVRLWELYNEPDNNHPEFASQGGCWGQHAAQYALLLQGAAPIIHAAGGQLVLGGLAYDYIEGYDVGGIFNGQFLDTLLNSPGGSSFDIMNFHYYRAFHERWDRYGLDVIGKTSFVRTKLIAKGLNKPIMVTEIGHPSAGPAADQQDYSDAASSRYVVQGLTRGLFARLYSMVWYQMVDIPGDPRKYGLLLSDFTPKPAYYAYQTHAQEIGGLTNPTQSLAGGLEAYTFNAGDRQKTVAWSSDNLTHTLSIAAGRIWVVDKLGGRQIVYDGAPADADARAGYVGAPVGIEPVYAYPFLAVDQPRVMMPLIMRRR
jgi:hypothetical protein